MCGYKKWITPFMKQSLAASSVILTMVSSGISIGYNVTLFSELRKTKEIPLDIDAESWLASVLGLTFVIGACFSSLIMETIGRKPTLLCSSIFMISGWISMKFASSFTLLLIGKIFQGLACGLVINVGGILIGEYCSPKHRGPFGTLLPFSVHFGYLIAHAFGIFYSWRVASTIFPIFSLPGLILTVLSPESPSFLVVKGRYEECKKKFRWLRGTSEDDELNQMIRAAVILKQSKTKDNLSVTRVIKDKVLHFIKVLKEREYWIPLVIMMHLNAFNQFNGCPIQDAYSYDVYTGIYGTDNHMFKIIASFDIFRLLSGILAIYIISKLNRRTILLVFTSLNIFTNILIAVYIYARKNDILPSYHMAIGVILQHFQFSFVGTSTLALVFVIEGEIFPLAGRGLCGMISSCITSFLIFFNIKSAPYVFSLIGVEGAFCISTIIMVYTLIVVNVLLPETKNKTLQEIEDEFRGYTVVAEEAVELNDMATKQNFTTS